MAEPTGLEPGQPSYNSDSLQEVEMRTRNGGTDGTRTRDLHSDSVACLFCKLNFCQNRQSRILPLFRARAVRSR